MRSVILFQLALVLKRQAFHKDSYTTWYNDVQQTAFKFVKAIGGMEQKRRIYSEKMPESFLIVKRFRCI